MAFVAQCKAGICYDLDIAIVRCPDCNIIARDVHVTAIATDIYDVRDRLDGRLRRMFKVVSGNLCRHMHRIWLSDPDFPFTSIHTPFYDERGTYEKRAA